MMEYMRFDEASVFRRDEKQYAGISWKGKKPASILGNGRSAWSGTTLAALMQDSRLYSRFSQKDKHWYFYWRSLILSGSYPKTNPEDCMLFVWESLTCADLDYRELSARFDLIRSNYREFWREIWFDIKPLMLLRAVHFHESLLPLEPVEEWEESSIMWWTYPELWLDLMFNREGERANIPPRALLGLRPNKELWREWKLEGYFFVNPGFAGHMMDVLYQFIQLNLAFFQKTETAADLTHTYHLSEVPNPFFPDWEMPEISLFSLTEGFLLEEFCSVLLVQTEIMLRILAGKIVLEKNPPDRLCFVTEGLKQDVNACRSASQMLMDYVWQNLFTRQEDIRSLESMGFHLENLPDLPVVNEAFYSLVLSRADTSFLELLEPEQYAFMLDQEFYSSSGEKNQEQELLPEEQRIYVLKRKQIESFEITESPVESRQEPHSRMDSISMPAESLSGMPAAKKKVDIRQTALKQPVRKVQLDFSRIDSLRRESDAVRESLKVEETDVSAETEFQNEKQSSKDESQPDQQLLEQIHSVQFENYQTQLGKLMSALQDREIKLLRLFWTRSGTVPWTQRRQETADSLNSLAEIYLHYPILEKQGKKLILSHLNLAELQPFLEVEQQSGSDISQDLKYQPEQEHPAEIKTRKTDVDFSSPFFSETDGNPEDERNQVQKEVQQNLLKEKDTERNRTIQVPEEMQDFFCDLQPVQVKVIGILLDSTDRNEKKNRLEALSMEAFTMPDLLLDEINMLFEQFTGDILADGEELEIFEQYVPAMQILLN